MDAMTTVTDSARSRRPIPTSLPLGRDSLAWRVNAEPIVFAGGGRALLMQVAHPGVGAGVEQHSSYASDPWGRLFRTVDVMMKLSFGSPEVSARQSRLLEKMHKRVVGVDDTGKAYNALNPDLLMWVWATLIDTSSLVHGLAYGPMTPDDQDRFYQESKLVAYGCGVPEGTCPGTWGEFQAYVDGVVANDLLVTDAARSVARASMSPPLPEPLGRAATAPHRLVTVGLLPPTVREQYGYSWSSRQDKQMHRVLATLGTGSRLAPRRVREVSARMAVNRKKPLRVPWLQRHGAELTARRLAGVPSATSGAPGA